VRALEACHTWYLFEFSPWYQKQQPKISRGAPGHIRGS